MSYDSRHYPSRQPTEEEKLIKVVCISDIHEMWEMGTLFSGPFPSGDILLIAGDVTFHGYHHKLVEFNKWLSKLHFGEIVMIPGNHDLTFATDWDEAAALVPNATCLNQETFVYDRLKIYGEPRQPEYGDWAFNVPRKRMPYVWDLVPTDTDVLLTHGPPMGAGDINPEGMHVGCEFQRAWIDEHQPRLVVCGHIHSGRGVYQIGKTLVVNASICNDEYVPVHEPIVMGLSQGMTE